MNKQQKSSLMINVRKRHLNPLSSPANEKVQALFHFSKVRKIIPVLDSILPFFA